MQSKVKLTAFFCLTVKGAVLVFLILSSAAFLFLTN